MVLRIYLEEKSAFISKGIQTQYNNLVSWCAFDKTFRGLAFLWERASTFYLDFSWINIKRLSQYRRQYNPTCFLHRVKKQTDYFKPTILKIISLFFASIFYILNNLNGAHGSENNLIKHVLIRKWKCIFGQNTAPLLTMIPSFGKRFVK